MGIPAQQVGTRTILGFGGPLGGGGGGNSYITPAGGGQRGGEIKVATLP